MWEIHFYSAHIAHWLYRSPRTCRDGLTTVGAMGEKTRESCMHSSMLKYRLRNHTDIRRNILQAQHLIDTWPIALNCSHLGGCTNQQFGICNWCIMHFNGTYTSINDYRCSYVHTCMHKRFVASPLGLSSIASLWPFFFSFNNFILRDWIWVWLRSNPKG